MSQGVVFRETLGWVVHAATSVVAAVAGVALLATGHPLPGALLVVAALVDARFAFGRAEVAHGQLVLRRFGASRAIPVAEIAWIDPTLEGTWMRAPRLGLRSGSVVRIDSFKVPTLMVSRSRAAAALATYLSVPMTATPASPAGWFADPLGGAGLRWWDGNAWTGVTLEDVGSDEHPASERGSPRTGPRGSTPGTQRSA